ncbi:hypothetical protein B0T25DRAFT_569648 [Lasiosphaeria hispida]|uniref:Uncharacterized protein n=1 Tax=Lasiosphaeria hispida TaxID=260671 RepID=A0AAJ0HDU9_9PEZI|nr:hypothetical protein B0T25DRAFT_569648 [Lasiosphaeria hispida]
MIFIFGGGGGELTSISADSTGTGLICQMHNTSYSITMDSMGAQTLLLGTEDVLPSFYTTHLFFTYLLVNNIIMSVSGTLLFPGNGGAKSIPLLQSALIYCLEIANATSDLDYLGIKDPSKCRNGTLARDWGPKPQFHAEHHDVPALGGQCHRHSADHGVVSA